MLTVIRLENMESPAFEQVCKWSYDWWGAKDDMKPEHMRYLMAHSVNTERLPQTFVALQNGTPVGMYQISMVDDLRGRPDIYPWLANVYVDEACRGLGICKELMLTVAENARKAGIGTLYLYTHHVGLYEKYGWEFVEAVETFKEDSPMERLYRLQIGE